MEGLAIDMAGVVGVDWRRFTFAQLRRMYLSRAGHDYRLNSWVVWSAYAFGGMGGRKKRLTPDDFNPLAEKAGKKCSGGMPFTASAVKAIGAALPKKTITAAELRAKGVV